MNFEHEMRLATTVLGGLASALGETQPTPVPTEFDELWARLREVVDAGPKPDATLELLARLPANACDPGSPSYVGYVPNAASPFARSVDAWLSIVNAVAAARVDGEAFVMAETAAADRIAELAGFPAETRGGTFVQGGTLANFCALTVARERWRRRSRSRSGGSPVVIGSRLTHSSNKLASRLLDMKFLPVDFDSEGRIDLEMLEAKVAQNRGSVAAIVGNAGTTRIGSVDDLAAMGRIAAGADAWFHVDGAYGGAVVLSAKYREVLAGLDAADSFVVDPHKWVFCPYDSSLLVYRDANEVHRKLQVFTQSDEKDAEYLDFGFRHTITTDGLNQMPAEMGDLALQLSRRPRGVVLWAMLGALGSDYLGERVANSIDSAKGLASYARSKGVSVPTEPQLSTIMLANPAWSTYPDWDKQWVRPAFEAGYFVSTDKWDDVPHGRICVVNPHATAASLAGLVDLVAGAT